MDIWYDLLLQELAGPHDAAEEILAEMMLPDPEGAASPELVDKPPDRQETQPLRWW